MKFTICAAFRHFLDINRFLDIVGNYKKKFLKIQWKKKFLSFIENK